MQNEAFGLDRIRAGIRPGCDMYLESRLARRPGHRQTVKQKCEVLVCHVEQSLRLAAGCGGRLHLTHELFLEQHRSSEQGKRPSLSSRRASGPLQPELQSLSAVHTDDDVACRLAIYRVAVTTVPTKIGASSNPPDKKAVLSAVVR